MKGRGAVITRYSADFEIREYPVPEVEPDAGLVRTARPVFHRLPPPTDADMLAAIASRFHLELDPNPPVVPWPSVTLRPRDGVRVTLRGRNREPA